MKYSLLSLTILTLGLISCGGDDTTTPSSNNSATYFPLSLNSSWSYTNESEDQTSQDNMFVFGTQQEGLMQSILKTARYFFHGEMGEFKSDELHEEAKAKMRDHYPQEAKAFATRVTAGAPLSRSAPSKTSSAAFLIIVARGSKLL